MERCATSSRSCFPVGSALWRRCYFHPIPFRGDPTGLEQHYLPKRGKADTSVVSFCVQEQESCVLCYANANLTRRDQAGETMRFVEFWYAITGRDPEWLYFDSKVTRYEELSKLNQRGRRNRVEVVTAFVKAHVDPIPQRSATQP